MQFKAMLHNKEPM